MVAAERSFAAPFFSSFINVYTTPKMVRIRSKWLRIPELCVSAIVAVYIVGYELGFLMGILGVDETIGVTRVEMDSMGDQMRCADKDVDCDDLPLDPADFGYCNSSLRAPWDETLAIGCKIFDVHEVLPHTHAGETMLATMVSVFDQKRCNSSGLACTRIWQNSRVRRHFVMGVEQFVIRVKQSFGAASHLQAQQHNSVGMPSFLKINGSFKPLPTWNASQNVPQADPCGLAEWGVQACFKSDWGDHFSVDTFLRAGGVRLDDTQGSNNFTGRYAGLAFRLDVEYTNVCPWDFWQYPDGGFWHWPPRLQPKILYTVTRVKMAETARTEMTWVAHENADQRVLIRNNGILIITSTRGMLGYISFLRIAATIAVSAALFQLGSLIVNHFLIQVYVFFSWTRSAHIVARLYQYDDTPLEEEVMQCVDAPMSLMRLERDREIRRKRTILAEDGQALEQ